jgi:hypothetical protein
MLIYLLVSCDRLEEKREKKLRQNLPELQAALQAYVDGNQANNVTLINDCESDNCEDWQLGISLARKYDIDCEVGYIQDDTREPVSYFGKQEGPGEAFLIAEYLDL